MIYALENVLPPDEHQAIETVMGDGSYEHVPFMHIVQILDRHGAISRAYDRARTFTDTSRNILVYVFGDSGATRTCSPSLNS